MDKDTKAKVEEYQSFLLRRYGLKKLAEKDQRKAGVRLKVQLDVNAGKDWRDLNLDGDTACLGEVPQIDNRSDFETLRFGFTLVIPTLLKNDTSELSDLPISGGDYRNWNTGRDLPFPPGIVEGISEEDLDLLAKVCGLSGAKRYTVWWDVYKQINEQFINWRNEIRDKKKQTRKKQTEQNVWDRVEDREKTGDWTEAAELAESVDPEYAAILRELYTVEKARTIPARIQQLTPEGIHVGCLVLLTATAFLAEERKAELNQALRDSKKKAGEDAEEDAEDFDRAKKLLKEIRWCIKQGDVPTQNEKRRMFASDIGYWLKLSLPEGFPDQMESRLEELKEKNVTDGNLHNLYQDFVSSMVPGKRASLSSKAPTTMRAFEATIEILEEKVSRQRASKVARELFGLWDIFITQSAARSSRQREKDRTG